MNHEEHVSQLKSEVRYIQEVATSARGSGSHAAVGGLVAGVCGLCLRGTARGATAASWQRS